MWRRRGAMIVGGVWSLKLYPFVDAILMPIKFKCQRYFKLPFTAEFLNSSLNFIIEPPYHNWNANIFSSFDKKKQKFCAPSANTSKCMFFWELDTPLYTLMMIVYIQWYRIFLGAPSLPPEILLQIRLDPPLWRSRFITLSIIHVRFRWCHRLMKL